MAKIIELKESGTPHPLCCPCKIYGLLITSSKNGSKVIVSDGDKEIITIITTFNCFYNVALAEPVVCKTNCTITIEDSGTTFVSVIFDSLRQEEH
jgi:hypothetical protein